MPATEQTWRDPKLMHLIFGVSALVMLLTTVWMFAADHTREWKGYQKTQAAIDSWYLRGRIDAQKSREHSAKLALIQAELAAAESGRIDAADIAAFKQEVVADAEQRGVEPFDLRQVDALYNDLERLAPKAADARSDAQQWRAAADQRLRTAQEAELNNLASARDARSRADEALRETSLAEAAAQRATEAAAEKRRELLAILNRVVKEAKLREDILLQKRKFKSAERDSKLSLHGIAISNHEPEPTIQALQDEVTALRAEVENLTLQYQDAVAHRKSLESIVDRITAAEDKARKELSEAEAELNRLQTTLAERAPNVGKTILGMPILDAFDNSDLRIEQIWLPDLKVNYNLADVARFDRCTSCHRAIEKTRPGSAVEPAYRHELPPFTVTLATPSEAPLPGGTTSGPQDATDQKLETAYGLGLAAEGPITASDVTIEFVRPQTRAAQAGLEIGDVIEQIDGAPILTRSDALMYLLQSVDWGSPIKLTIRRGLPHPYSSHPRLDLFVGPQSPHKLQEVGCTICHDGQGSGTAFKWASHTPNTPDEATEWRREHDWFDNHHWIFPMFPQRFLESGCLKCHHDVTELEPSDRFPDPPAPKLMAGYNLVRRYGCFGCHEINGYDGPDQRIGPDLRSEPNFFAVAQALLEEATLSDEERRWAAQLVEHPEDDKTRRQLYEAITADSQPDTDGEEDAEPRHSPATHKLGSLLKDVETPGKFRRVGPSLRYLASKADFEFLYSWIRKPADFRPSSRMPRFFGLWDHLKDEGLKTSQRFEPIEIRAVTEYLLAASQPFDYLPKPEAVTEAPSAERGKLAFQLRGCLACHAHADFPEVAADQGPDLSRVASKFNTPNGRKWLYSWIRQPSRYHVRTKMPDLFLEPIVQDDGKVTDPAADIAEYLLAGPTWQPKDVPSRQLSKDDREALYELAYLHLKKAFPERRAKQYLEGGIPESLAEQAKGDDRELIGETTDPEVMVHKQLLYVGRRTISKFGCSGCHDIPGYEDAKPIGTGLADWGRKDPSKLAFEQIANLVFAHGDEDDAHGDHGETGHAEGAEQAHDEHVPNAGISDEERKSPDTGYFLMALSHHNRQGFLWQKLRRPRSYDYEKTANKDYNERLRMPRFPLDNDEREAIMTFVLGLVSEPPAAQYVYHPDPQRAAIAQGRRVLDKYNCAGCHTLQMERWEFDYHPDNEFLQPPASTPDFPFLSEPLTSEEITKSLATDRRGLRHAVLHGRPAVSDTAGKPLLFDQELDPVTPGQEDQAEELFYSFELWKPSVINGEPRLVGSPNLLVRDSGTKKYPAWGGLLADYLFPHVIAYEKQRNPQVKGGEAWGWLPPPLIGEGRKVQTGWLHDFLLEPYPIRPAVVLRMPKFNMTSEEATQIANYFAAINDVEYPYQLDERGLRSHLARQEAEHPGHLADALKIIVDNNYCVKCHWVGDFRPQGSLTAQAPNLDQVGRRLRPDFLRDWIANPKRILPYTGMPVNIPYKPGEPHDGGVSQELYPGSSIEQLDAVVDFLLNYDLYSRRQVSIKPLVKPPAPAEAAAGAETGGGAN